MLVYGDASQHTLVRAAAMAYITSEQYFFQNYISEDFQQYVERMKVINNIHYDMYMISASFTHLFNTLICMIYHIYMYVML
jgi:hypothetical protein